MRNQSLKIYRDGKLDRWETYRPLPQAQLVILGEKVNYWFETQGH